MTEFDLLITAHEANEREGLGLTPAQIVRVLEQYEGKRHPRPARMHYADPTADQALRNIT